MGDDEHEIEHQVRVLGPRRRRPESPLRVESHHGLSQVYVLERLETGCCLLRRQQSPVSFSVNLLRERAETFSEQEREKRRRKRTRACREGRQEKRWRPQRGRPQGKEGFCESWSECSTRRGTKHHGRHQNQSRCSNFEVLAREWRQGFAYESPRETKGWARGQVQAQPCRAPPHRASRAGGWKGRRLHW